MGERKVPMRRCIGCRESFPQSDLIRLTYAGTEIHVDRNGRAKGRGVYLCRNTECIEKARKSRAFNRNYKKDIREDTANAAFDEALALIKEEANGEKDI